MKIWIGLFLITFLTQTSAFAKQITLSCQSQEVVEGWSGSPTKSFVNFKALVLDTTVLSHVEISGAYNATSAGETVRAKADPTLQYSRYQFGAVEDAWHWFFLLLPKDFMQTNGSFQGALQVYKEDSPYPTFIDMQCRLLYKI
jgi:hypothetical protein